MSKQGLVLLAGILLVSGLGISATYDPNDLADIMVTRSTGAAFWYEYNPDTNLVVNQTPSSFTSSVVAFAAWNDNGNENGTLLTAKNISGTGYGIDYSNAGEHTVAFKSQFYSTSGHTINAANGITAGDFDGDGLLDAFIAQDNCTVRFEKTSSGTWSFVQTFSGGNHNAVKLGNFNNDANEDLMLCSTAAIYWYSYVSGAVTLKGTINNASGSAWNVSDIAMGDFDGDSQMDMFVVSGGTVQWIENTGVNTWAYIGSVFGSNVSCVEIGDVNGDGVAELVLGHLAATANWYATDGNDGIKSIVGWDIGYAQDIAFFTVPEPAAMTLMGLGCLFMLRRRLRK